MDLSKLTSSLFNGEHAEILRHLEKSAGVSTAELSSLAAQFLPEATSAVQNNLIEGNLIQKLMSLVSSINVSDLTSEPNKVTDSQNIKIGENILQAIFGNKENVESLTNKLSENSSIDLNTISRLLPSLSTAVIGIAMSKQGSNLASLMTSAFQKANEGANGDSTNGIMNLAKGFLDKDGDGSIADDLLAGLSKKLI